ncbi:MAG: TlpA disulfide reductase family protein [Woeseiaceae bacterium]|nr:TlpA disulfide reductase family protein [Woeseiaceae bacterium]
MQNRQNYARHETTSAAKIAAILCLLAGLTALAACQSHSEPTIGHGGPAPTFQATTVDGRSIAFPEDFTDGPTVVLMWSTWCPYCKVLMPRLSEIKADYRSQGLQILAINAKERGYGDPALYVQEAGFDFLTIADGDLIADKFDVEYLPGVFVVSSGGDIAYRRGWTELPAGQSVADLWEEQIRSILEELADMQNSAKEDRSARNAY